MADNYFSELNGYKVKDAYARESIETLRTSVASAEAAAEYATAASETATSEVESLRDEFHSSLADVIMAAENAANALNKAEELEEMLGNLPDDDQNTLEMLQEIHNEIENVRIMAEQAMEYQTEYNLLSYYPSDGDDCTTELQDLFDMSSIKPVRVPAGEYWVKSPLTVYGNVTFDPGAIIMWAPEDDSYDACIVVEGEEDLVVERSDCVLNGRTLVIPDENSLQDKLYAGAIVRLVSSEVVSEYARERDTVREIAEIESANGNTITFKTEPVYHFSDVEIYVQYPRENIELKGINIKDAYSEKEHYGIRVKHGKNITIDHCSITGFKWAGVACFNSTNINVTNCHIDCPYDGDLQYGVVYMNCWYSAISNNTINCKRTAIDVSLLSNFVSVTGNACFGSISSHSCSNITFTGNTINGGGLSIRSNKTIASNNVCKNGTRGTLYLGEMSAEGDVIISNNIFAGGFGVTLPSNGVTFTNNTISATSGTNKTDRVILMALSDEVPERKALVISGNRFEFTGESDLPVYCIDCYEYMRKIQNVRIENNEMNGFNYGIYASQLVGNIGNNLTIRGNAMSVYDQGIAFRLCNNVRIENNTISSLGNKTGEGIAFVYADSAALKRIFVSGNIITGFNIGVQLEHSADLNDMLFENNVYDNCNTNYNGITKIKSRICSDLVLADTTGKQHKITVGTDGSISST